VRHSPLVAYHLDRYEEPVQIEAQSQAAAQVSVSNSIGSMTPPGGIRRSS